MLKNFFIVAMRNLFGQKYYAAINILGLAVALAAFLLINLYVVSEFSYDRHHPDSERIYRIQRDFVLFDQDQVLPGNAAAVGTLLRDAFAEVEDATRIFPKGLRMARAQQTFNEDAIRAVDANHFDFFAYEWLQGSPASALTQPFTVVMTQSLARKYFGDVNPLGETLLVEERLPFTVTGLIEDPSNTHITASAFISMTSMPALGGEDFFDSWNTNSFHTYLRLQPGPSYAMLEDRISNYLSATMPDNQQGFWDFQGLNVADIHLRSRAEREELSALGNEANLRALILIGLGLLSIACINFINITTARSARRGKEVAVKKTLGSGSSILILQFWGESLLQILLSVCLALAMVELTLPLLQGLTGKDLALGLWGNPTGMLLLSGSTLFLAVAAGAYPAFYLARSRPALGIRGQTVPATKNLSLRSLLVVFQFTVSIALLIATSVIALQLKLGREIELGFNNDRILTLKSAIPTGFEGTNSTEFGPQWPALKNELSLHPGISRITRSNITPFGFAETAFSRSGVRYEGGPEEGMEMTVMFVDFDFFETYEVALLAGRTFSESAGTDRHTLPREEDRGTYIINEAAAAQLGWAPEEAIGKWLYTNQRRIVGVVENMKMESLREEVKPVHYYVPVETGSLDTLSFASLRLTGENLPGTLAYIDETWNRFYPEQPIRRSFLDTAFDALYQQDTQFGKFVGFFALLTVLISCVGLHGLAGYAAEQRTKEIGVRKVMGSSVWSIIVLFANDFGRLVLLSNIIAWPLAYLAMQRWLENFAYRIDLTPLIFIGSGLIALCIAWVTVGGTAAKAASQRPVLALRYE